MPQQPLITGYASDVLWEDAAAPTGGTKVKCQFVVTSRDDQGQDKDRRDVVMKGRIRGPEIRDGEEYAVYGRWDKLGWIDASSVQNIRTHAMTTVQHRGRWGCLIAALLIVVAAVVFILIAGRAIFNVPRPPI